MAERIGFIHVSNKMRTKWEEGVRKNKEKLLFAKAVLQHWEERDGWRNQPAFMCKLQKDVRRQEQYLRNRYGEVLDN